MSIPITTKANGLFKAGNKAAAGHSSKSQKLRAGILSAISQSDIKAITQKLVEQARGGDQGAAKLLLQFIGKPAESSGTQVLIQNSNAQSGATMSDDERRAVTRAIVERLRSARALEAPTEDP